MSIWGTAESYSSLVKYKPLHIDGHRASYKKEGKYTHTNQNKDSNIYSVLLQYNFDLWKKFPCSC